VIGTTRIRNAGSCLKLTTAASCGMLEKKLGGNGECILAFARKRRQTAHFCNLRELAVDELASGNRK
jgi:hypothetical protein